MLSWWYIYLSMCVCLFVCLYLCSQVLFLFWVCGFTSFAFSCSININTLHSGYITYKQHTYLSSVSFLLFLSFFLSLFLKLPLKLLLLRLLLPYLFLSSWSCVRMWNLWSTWLLLFPSFPYLSVYLWWRSTTLAIGIVGQTYFIGPPTILYYKP